MSTARERPKRSGHFRVAAACRASGALTENEGEGTMRKDGGIFNLFVILGCAAFALMALYWLAALAFVVIMAVWGVVCWLTAKLLRWPIRKIAIPAALNLQIGRTVPTALLGLAVIVASLIASTEVIRVFHEPALRRVGQSLSGLKEQLGTYGDKLEAVAGEGIGYQRIQRWGEWIWAQDVSTDDTHLLLAGENNAVPEAAFNLSGMVNSYGLELEARLFEGERHSWFIYVYWFLAAVLAPFLISMFLVTVYQLSARRLTTRPGVISSVLQGLSTIFICYSLFTAFYLLPYVSHPYHSIGAPFWAATILYIVAATVCCGVIRANQDVLFSSEFHPEAARMSEVIERSDAE